MGKSTIDFDVIAQDSGEPPLNSTTKVTLQLMVNLAQNSFRLIPVRYLGCQ